MSLTVIPGGAGGAEQAPKLDIEAIRQLVADDLRAVDGIVLEQLRSDVALINQLGHYIIRAGGKRLRPLLVVLAARACGYKGEHHNLMAAVIEFIHTATLLHDDVVDESDQRRGRATANAEFGNAASVLVGDFLYSRAFEMMVKPGSMDIMETLSHATNRIAEGEVLQLLNCNNADATEQGYRDVIDRKTATLFAAGTEVAGILSACTDEQRKGLNAYGHHLGMAFQMADDVLDYEGSDTEIGKNLGDDLAEGKATLPLIRAMAVGNDDQKELLRDAIINGRRDAFVAVRRAIESTDAIAYTFALARREVEQAQAQLSIFPDSPYKRAMIELADFALVRKS